MRELLFDWPYLGLGIAVVLIAYLLLEPRDSTAPPRWRSPDFILPLLAPMYLLHQFEEHGIDAMGRHFAFLGALCGVLGRPGGAGLGCPADAGFIFAVNVGACGIAFISAFAFRRSRPLIAACAWGIPLVNAVTHVGSAVIHRSYNPGLVTALVLFLPLGGWMLHVVARVGIVRGRSVIRVLATGGLVHLVILVSLWAREHGLPYGVLFAVNVLNGLWPLLFGTVGSRRSALPFTA